MNQQKCNTTMLTKNAIGEIRLCPECKVVSLTIQALTLRFTLDAYRQLSELVTQTSSEQIQTVIAEHQHTEHGIPPKSTVAAALLH